MLKAANERIRAWNSHPSAPKALLIITLLGGLLPFLPFIFDIDSNLEGPRSTLVESIRYGNLYRDSSLVGITLAAPLFLDIFMDFAAANFFKLSGRTNRSDILGANEQFILLCAFIMCPVVAYSSASKLGLMYLCCNRSQLSLVAGVVGTSFTRFDSDNFPPVALFFTYILFVISQTLGTFTANSIAGDPSYSSKHPGVSTVTSVLAYIAISLFVFALIRWVAILARNKILGRYMTTAINSAKNITAEPTNSHYMYFRLVYVATILIWIAVRVAAALLTPAIASATDMNLFLSNVPYIIMQLSILVFSMRLVKLDAIETLCALIEAKRHYVRYISHELRTPLNAASAGLQILEAELRCSADPDDDDRLDTLRDVSLSVTTTVDILNDLLCFEKLESGIMELHKEDVNVRDFVHSCASIFKGVARGKNIDLQTKFTDATEEGAVEITKHDTVNIDKFKISQVFRNFLSNALKFTPNNGKVIVQTSFIPNATAESLEKPLFLRTSTGKRWSLKSMRVNPRRPSLVAEGKCVPDNAGNAFGGVLRISVTDTGAGISPQDQEKLFKGVVQFRPEVLQAGGGSGFGLFICKGIVDLHGGEIGVYSAGEGHGSTFFITLPMIHIAPEHSPEESHGNIADFKQISREIRVEIIDNNRNVDGAVGAAKVDIETTDIRPADNPSRLINVGATKQLTKPTSAKSPRLMSQKQLSQKKYQNQGHYDVLVVDDSPLNRKMLIKLLKTVGHTCEEAEDGLLAVAKVKLGLDAGRGEYDVILMDFIMPNMDGPTATREIRKIGCKGPVIGLTGNGLPSDIKTFMDSGATAVLVKPLVLDDFHTVMARIEDPRA